MKKRILAIIVCLFMLVPILSSCNRVKDDGKITVVCTVFPIYDWVRTVAGEVEGIEVKLLLSDGSDAHSYQPSFDDVIMIKEADLTVRIGGSADGFVDEILEGAEGGSDLVLREAEGVTVREMSSESHVCDEDHDHDHGSEDEHIWLSLRNARASTAAIAAELSRIDPDNAGIYRANADKYCGKLDLLDREYEATVASAQNKRLIFADRFPFVYMTDDYGIEYLAAFKGCTTESDASFDTVFKLAKKVDEWGLSFVCVSETSDRKLADTVIGLTERKNAKIVTFDSMQAVSSKKIEEGYSYLSVMEKNLDALRIALGIG